MSCLLHKLQSRGAFHGRREFVLHSLQVQPALRLSTRRGLQMVHRLRTWGHQATGERWRSEGPMDQRGHGHTDGHLLHGYKKGREAEAHQAISGTPLLDKHPHQPRRETFTVSVRDSRRKGRLSARLYRLPGGSRQETIFRQACGDGCERGERRLCELAEPGQGHGKGSFGLTRRLCGATLLSLPRVAAVTGHRSSSWPPQARIALTS